MVLPRSGEPSTASAPAPLGADDLAALLRLARAAVEASVRREPGQAPDPRELPPAVLGPAAAFVTLHEHGILRGCMGQLDWDRAAWENVMRAGGIVARDDPRFMPVTPEEMPAIRLEVSVLAPPVELADASEFVAGRDGIIVQRGGRRALLLPQVAEELGWDSAAMLDAVCEKAGLARDAWRWPGTRLFAFRAVRASEAGFAG